ncbi:MAG: hypothetical protein AAFQ87_27495, partial [Bacteroidota bacterium]
LFDLGDDAEKDGSFQVLATMAPIQTDLVKQTTDRLNIKGDTLGAYNLIQHAVTFDQWNVEMLKIYALQCIKAGFPALGEKALEELRSLLPASEFEILEADYREIEELLTPEGFG